MKHLAAYMLLVLGGNASPSEKDVTKLLTDSGVKADADQIKCLMDRLKDQDIVKCTKEGMHKFASMPSGGAAAAAPAGGAAAAAPAEAKKEAKKEESEEEADVDMGGLFGDDY